MLKKRINHSQAHSKSVTALKKAGVSGLLITDDGQNTYVSLIGKMPKAMATIHMAFLKTGYLKQIAEIVAGPRVSMYKEDSNSPPDNSEDQVLISGDTDVENPPEITQDKE